VQTPCWHPGEVAPSAPGAHPYPRAGGRGDGPRVGGRRAAGRAAGIGLREARYGDRTDSGHPESIGRCNCSPGLQALAAVLFAATHPHPHAGGRGDGPRAAGGGRREVAAGRCKRWMRRASTRSIGGANENW
jgi:hypothetical protein